MHHPTKLPVSLVTATVVVTGYALFGGSGPVSVFAQNELDTFMERVLERRDENWITLQQYILDERETAEVLGPLGVRLQGFDREYVWYEQEGFLIRSPVRFDGVTIGDPERREYEADWLGQERRRAALPPEEREQLRSRRSAYDHVMLSIEREWGKRVSRQLGRAVTADARLRGDGFAAMAVATDDIVTDLGGVDAVGLDMVLARTRDGFVLLEHRRLDGEEVTEMLVPLLDRLPASLETASPEQLDAFVELVELAARFGLDMERLESAISDAERVVAARDLTGHDVARRLDRARRLPAREGSADWATSAENAVGLAPSGLQPRFLSEAFFLDAPFEPGNYYFAGRDEVEGKEVVKIEYYPKEMFEGTGQTESADREAQIEAGFDKTSLVTLWIDPVEHQIVKFAFDNVGFDFLPMRWLMRLDDLTASMVMGQFFDGIWLPAAIEFEGRVTLATGTYLARYTRTFTNYREATSDSRVLTGETSPPR